MVSLTLSTLPPIFPATAASGDPLPTALGHPKSLAACSVRCSLRRPIKSLAFASVPLSGVAVDEEDGSSPERYHGDATLSDFGRLKWDSDKKGCRLQTAVVGYRKRSFSPSTSLRVDLVSLIHIADKEYFTTLQEELRQYDCVLYEMIACREDLEEGLDTQDPSIFNFVGFIAPIFGLRWQTSCLNYSSPNWFHADIDMETYFKLQQEKGINFFTNIEDEVKQSGKKIPNALDWRSKIWAHRYLMGRSAAGTDQASDYAHLEALYNFDVASAIKISVANIINTLMMRNGDRRSAFVGERNVAATEALRKAINNGHKKIAMLYGCGHMPDLGRRLQEDFDLVPSDDVRWKTAWTIRIRELDTSSSPFQKTMVTALGWFTILLVQAADLAYYLMTLAFAGVLTLTLYFFETAFYVILLVILFIFSPKSLDSVLRGEKPKIGRHQERE